MAAPRGRGRAWEQPRAAQHTGDAASRHGACAAATEPPHPARVPHPRSGAGGGRRGAFTGQTEPQRRRRPHRVLPLLSGDGSVVQGLCPRSTLAPRRGGVGRLFPFPRRPPRGPGRVPSGHPVSPTPETAPHSDTSPSPRRGHGQPEGPGSSPRRVRKLCGPSQGASELSEWASAVSRGRPRSTAPRTL